MTNYILFKKICRENEEDVENILLSLVRDTSGKSEDYYCEARLYRNGRVELVKDITQESEDTDNFIVLSSSNGWRSDSKSFSYVFNDKNLLEEYGKSDFDGTHSFIENVHPELLEEVQRYENEKDLKKFEKFNDFYLQAYYSIVARQKEQEKDEFLRKMAEDSQR